MSTITTILKPNPDGTLHLPVPEEWRDRPIRVTASLEPVEQTPLEAYSTEWQDAFGSIEDETFVAPDRSNSRPVEALEGS